MSLKAAALINGVSGIARLLGYPTPYLPKEMMEKAFTLVGRLDQESSVSEFASLQDYLDEVDRSSKIGTGDNNVHEKAKKFHGSALRELERLLAAEDTDRSFCGLSCVVTPEGYSIWTNNENRLKLEEEGKKEELSYDTLLGSSTVLAIASTDAETQTVSDDSSPFLVDIEEVAKASSDKDILSFNGAHISISMHSKVYPDAPMDGRDKRQGSELKAKPSSGSSVNNSSNLIEGLQHESCINMNKELQRKHNAIGHAKQRKGCLW